MGVGLIMKKMLNKIEKIIPVHAMLPMLLVLSVQCFAFWGTRLFTIYLPHYDFTSTWDRKIPVIPWTSAIYFSCYLVWVANHIIACRQEKRKVYRFYAAELISMVVCMLFFCLMPTTNVRPQIGGNTFWDEVMRFLYQVDRADNLFPSIHCLLSSFCFIAVRWNKKVPFGYKLFTLLDAFAVFVCTLTTKQHILIDVIGGILLAKISFHLVEITGFTAWFEKKMDGILRYLRFRACNDNRKKV